MKLHGGVIVLIVCISGVFSAESTGATSSSTNVKTTQTETTVTTASTQHPTETTTSVTTTPAAETTTVTKSEPETTTKLASTVAPTKAPVAPTQHTWEVQEDGEVCIRAKMALQLHVHADDLEKVHDLSPNATVDNSSQPCTSSNDTQFLTLKDDPFEITFLFLKSGKQVYVANITVMWSEKPVDEDIVQGKFFPVTADRSYQCSAQDPINMNNLTLTFFDVTRLQAFSAKGSKDFALAELCANDDKMNDIVPIAVACALCAMVVIILISYLVFRRRTRQTGYESV